MFRQGQNYVDRMQQAGPNGKPRIGSIMQEAGGRLAVPEGLGLGLPHQHGEFVLADNLLAVCWGGPPASARLVRGAHSPAATLATWTDAIVAGSYRGLRGGIWDGSADYMESSSAGNYAYPASGSDGGVGFRVASVPEPGSIAFDACRCRRTP